MENSSENMFSVNDLLKACEESGTVIEGLHRYLLDHNDNPSVPPSMPPDNADLILKRPEDHNNQIAGLTSTNPVDRNAFHQPEGDVQSLQSPSTGRKRSRKRDRSNWKAVVNQNKRMRGEEHYKQKRGKNAEEVIQPARKLGPPCLSRECSRRGTNRHCQKFPESTRTAIFRKFWAMDSGQKRVFLIDHVTKQNARKIPKEGPSCRKQTFGYYLEMDGSLLQVCKAFFLSTLSLGEKQVRNWVSKGCTNRKEREQSARDRDSAKKLGATNFLDSLPKLESHYCRKETTKLYLEQSFTTMADLFRAYLEYCQNQNIENVSTFTFTNLVDEKNIALYKPKKDLCDICEARKAGNFPDDRKYNEHIGNKKAARAERDKDKLKALIGEVHVVEMDMQAVKVSPVLNASALYYKTKLMVHNFTVFDLATLDAKCFLWDETEADLQSSVFASCLIEFLGRYEDSKPIIIFSDGCTSQNRNHILSTGLLDLAIRSNKTIYQKYFEKGHTHMEVDSAHAKIEVRLKGRVIYQPTDYIDICLKSRFHPRPYEVTYKRHTDFKDYSREENQRYSSIRPGNKAKENVVTDIRQLKYNPDGTIDFKLDFNSDWKPLPRNPKSASSNFPPLFAERRLISKRKFKDLQDILHVIPAEFHDFYKNLPSGSK